MNKQVIICPCCGHPFYLNEIQDSGYADMSKFGMRQIASNLGIEIGMKGGEEIGD